jgi:hypothetical protein
VSGSSTGSGRPRTGDGLAGVDPERVSGELIEDKDAAMKVVMARQ